MEWGQALQIIIMVMIGAVGFLLRADRETTKTRLKENADAINSLDTRLDNLERELPFTYVTREDYIRQQAHVENKLDKIYSLLERGQSR